MPVFNPRKLDPNETGAFNPLGAVSSFVGGMQSYNELKNAISERMMKEAKAKYAAQNEEELYKQLLDSGLIKKAEAKYAEPNAFESLRKSKLGNQILEPQAKHAEEETLLNLAGKRGSNESTSLGNQLKRIQAQFQPDIYKAQIANQNRLASGQGSGGTADQKNLNAFTSQLVMDNPKKENESQGDYVHRINKLQSSYLSGEEIGPDGTPLAPLSGTAEQILNSVQGSKAPVAVKNQAANYDLLYNDLKEFDIDAAASLSGPKGKAKLLYAQAQMATNPDDPNIDPMARRYLTAMNQAIYNMDTMRKAFGTSVVPDYVYKTIGKLTNPADSIWNDPTQVKKNYKSVVDAVKTNRDLLMNKVKHGVTYSKSESKKGESSMTPESLKNMSDEEFNKLYSSRSGG